MRLVLVGIASAALALAPAARAAQAPSRDDFYSPPSGLTASKPGTVLRERTVNAALAGAAPAQATQLLYRTTDQLGRPSATVATILKPSLALGPVKLLSYQTAYDGVADTCRPSFALQQGNSGANTIVTAEGALIAQYLAQGFTVVTSDYQGPTDDYGAGREEGRNTLDAIRAAEHVLRLEAKTPTALTGYSGGSIASMWAAELAPDYAPELNLVGIAAGGIPVDFAHNLAYIDGSPDWAGAIPAVGMGLARAYRLDLGRLLGAKGKQIVKAVEKGCLDQSAYPGLKFGDMLKPRYRDWHHVPELVRVFNDSIMGRGATPKTPLLLGVGDRGDGGDGVMLVKDVQQLAHSYCDRGLATRFHVYGNADHVAALARFAPEAMAFLQQRFADDAADSDCPVAAGAPLDPLPAPAARPRLTTGIGLRRVGRRTVEISAPTSALAAVSVTVGGRTTSIGDLPTFGRKRLRLSGSQARSRVVATGRLQTAAVRATLRRAR